MFKDSEAWEKTNKHVNLWLALIFIMEPETRGWNLERKADKMLFL